MLVRQHVARRLAAYYAQPADAVVGTLSSSPTSSSSSPSDDDDGAINFRALWGEAHWRRRLRSIYGDGGVGVGAGGRRGQWVTPVELFRPHYSRCVANFVAQDFLASRGPGSGSGSGPRVGGVDPDAAGGGRDDDDGRLLHIVELGGGRGTNALAMLSHFRDNYPDLYEGLSYTLVDASPTLHELQRRMLLGGGDGGGDGAGRHGDKVSFVHADLIDVATGGYALALELLDNLPHDKVMRDGISSAVLQAEVVPLPETSAAGGATPQDVHDASDAPIPPPSSHGGGGNADAPLAERFVPLDDPLLKRVMDAVPSYANVVGGGTMARWVPTVACGVVDELFRKRPNARLVAADFDWLPPPDLATGDDRGRRPSAMAEGDPLVTDMDGVDHGCYLTPSSAALCDILFPTDFRSLASFVRTRCEGADANVNVVKQAEFLQKFGPDEVEATSSWLTGYSPLVGDFANCSVLTVTRGGKA